MKKRKRPERGVAGQGEVKLHGPDAVDQFNELAGTPVDDMLSPLVEDGLGKVQIPELPKIQPPDSGKDRILVVIPILDITLDFFESFVKFWQDLMLRHAAGELKYEIGYHFIYKKPVHIAETYGANVAINNSCTHVMFIDDDIYDLSVDHLNMLYEADKDVIGGVMYTSGFPYSQCTFRRYDTKETVCSQPVKRGIYRLYEVPADCPTCASKGETTRYPTFAVDFCPKCRTEMPKDWPIQKVDLIPFGFTLIKTRVFKKIRRPWFHCNSIFPTDSWFADRCIEAGIQEYVHMHVRLNHRGINDDTQPFRLREASRLVQNKGKILRISPEMMEMQMRSVEEHMEEAEKLLKLKDQPKFVKAK